MTMLTVTPISVFAAPVKIHCGIPMQYTTANWTGSYNHFHGILQRPCTVTYTETGYYYTCISCGARANEIVRSNEKHNY